MKTYLLHYKVYIFSICCLLLCLLNKQVRAQDSIANPQAPALQLTTSSQDTSVTDTTTKNVVELERKWGVKISHDALPDVLKTTANDSAILKIKEKYFFLHGKAEAMYTDIHLKSAHIRLDQQKMVVDAYPDLDTANKKTSLQEFKQGGEIFYYDTLSYNFKSKRAIVRNARMQYGEGFIQSKQIKRNEDESVYGWKSVYTTCNIEDHPHFGIRANRIKMVPNRVVVSGPANLEIQEIPTPLILPFGVFPTSKGQSSGFVLPSYTMEQRRGLGLMRGGYYFAVNDYIGFTALMDIFSKGSWGLFTSTQYNKRYKYNGNLQVNYSKSKWGEPYELDAYDASDFKIIWSHAMDSKSRPGTNFSASVDVGSSNYNQINGRSANMVLNNQYTSSISYSKNWVGKPYTFNASLRHNQSTQTGSVTVTLPELNFSLGQLSPFQRKNMIGKARWYEKVTSSYNVKLTNQIQFYDTLFNKIKLNDFNNGLVQNVNIQANYNVLKFFTLGFNMPYNEYWNTKQMYIYGIPTNTRDTVSNQGFFATRDFSFSGNLTTRIYGMKMFKKGAVQGIRHVVMPTIGFRYVPNFANDFYNYMYRDYDDKGQVYFYSPYTGSPIGGPNNYIETGAITFGINNTLQMKRRAKDTIAENPIVSLIDGLNISGMYNLFADTNKLSDINMTFRTSIANKFNISSNATFTPYHYEGIYRTRHFLYDKGEGIAKLNNAAFTVGFSFKGAESTRGTVQDSTDLNDESQNEDYKNLMKNNGIDQYYDFSIPWEFSTNMGLRINRSRSNTRADSFILTPNLTFNGSVNLTERWKINVTSGVDFTNMKEIKLGYTMIDVVRDLHCWQMSLNLVPFGQLRSFYFSLQVKASVLQDLKLTRRRSFQDNF